MKLRQMIPKKKLRATAVRRGPAPSRSAMDEEEEEPTMRLSSACIVVLLLHLVAIGGIITFEKVKVNRTAASVAEETAKIVGATSAVNAAAPASVAPQQAVAPVAAAPVAQAPAPVQEVRKSVPAPAPAPVAAGQLKDSGNFHVVAKGENPVAIAKKLGVAYEDLLKLNKIEDPRKLQPGQKLKIPAKAK
jgi:LysM repeat protein